MLAASPPLVVSGGQAPGANQRLPVSMNQQCMRQWCWAAVLEMVAGLIGTTPNTQCEIASKVLSAPCCPCPHPQANCNPACDQAHVIEDALAPPYPLGLRYSGTADGTGVVVGFDRIVNEIQARRRPVCCRIDLDDGGYHYVAIVGAYADPTPEIVVCDPLHGSETAIAFSTFCTAYKAQQDNKPYDGHWAHATFFA